MNKDDIITSYIAIDSASANLVNALVAALDNLNDRIKHLEASVAAPGSVDPLPNLESRVLDIIRDNAPDVADYLSEDINKTVLDIIDDKLEGNVERLVDDAIYNIDKGDFVREGLRDIL